MVHSTTKKPVTPSNRGECQYLKILGIDPSVRKMAMRQKLSGLYYSYQYDIWK